MAGLIWFVQLVHYPAYHHVGSAEFQRYQTHHQRATSWVVGPPMLLELATTLALILRPIPSVPAAWPWIGLILLAIIWLSTALLQVPLHTKLLTAPTPAHIRRLVQTNWLRTIAWTLRAALSLAMLAA